MDDSFVERPGSIPTAIRFRTNSDQNLKDRKGIQWIADVKRKPIEWLWEPYIPIGRITMLGGDPGAGKSFITNAIAAARSRGKALPGDKDEVRSPMSVLLLSVEDDPADTLYPRLLALDADMERIAYSTEDIVLDNAGLSAIRQMTKQANAKLVILDPIVAFLGAKMDMNRANEVRHIMKGLAKIAKDENIAILVVRHNRKEAAGQTGKAIYAGMGSIDFTASVRSELAVTESKNGVKFFNHIKANSGRKGQSLTYSITSGTDGEPVFAWGDFTTWPPGAGAKPVIEMKFRDEEKVKRWIFDQLTSVSSDVGVLAIDLASRAKLAGYSDTKMQRAKKGLVISVKRNDGWYWTLDPNTKFVVD